MSWILINQNGLLALGSWVLEALAGHCSCFGCWLVGGLKGLLGGGLGSRRTFRIVGAKAIYQWPQKYFIILITTVAVFVCNGCMSLRYRGHKECHLRDVQVPQFSSSLQSSLSFQTFGFPDGSADPPVMQETKETRVWSLGWEHPLEKEMETHSSILTWRTPGQRGLVGYSPQGHKESSTTERPHFHFQLNYQYGFVSIFCFFSLGFLSCCFVCSLVFMMSVRHWLSRKCRPNLKLRKFSLHSDKIYFASVLYS